MTLNRFECIGNLGRDVEVKTFQSGDRIANFTVATTEKFKDRNGERQEHTEWSNWTVRGGLVDVAERYLKKGSKVFLAGKKRTRDFTDRDGNKRQAVEFLANELTMLDGAPKQEGGERSPNAHKNQNGFGTDHNLGTSDHLDDDIPGWD